jgi:hypothetical protein
MQCMRWTLGALRNITTKYYKKKLSTGTLIHTESEKRESW